MRIAVLPFAVLFVRLTFAACPIDRAPVKSATDSQANQISLLAMPATIASLHSMPSTRPLPYDSRIAPAEKTIYSVTATLVGYRLTTEGEIQLVLSDHERRTILATIPAATCMKGSRFEFDVTHARANFERLFTPTTTFVEARHAIEVQGIGFFDFHKGQRGLAPNGLSLYPVTVFDPTPSFQPQAPPIAGRRRAAGNPTPVAGCSRPSLTITTSRASACAGDSVTVHWNANDSKAIVDIAGIGNALPASGSRAISHGATTIYSGRATTSCGTSDEATALVTLTSSSSASLSGPSSMTSGTSAALTIFINNASSWTLTSALGNPISPNKGTTSQSATYRADRTGSDTVTLTTTGAACGTLSIFISAAPGGGGGGGGNTGLRCCDGTRSPTCFDCNNKRGCCSSHGGVCGC